MTKPEKFEVYNKTNPFVNVGNAVPSLTKKELNKLIFDIKKTRRLNRRDKQTKTLIKLGLIWKKCPELRFGQFIMNAIKTRQMYYISDEELLNRIESFYGLRKRRRHGIKK